MPEPVLDVRGNYSQDVADLLMAAFQVEGCRTVIAFTLDIKRVRLDFDTWLGQHQPRAAVCDIAVPYRENWAFSEERIRAEAGDRLPFVLTTFNKAALESLVGETPARDITGRPCDIDEVERARKLGRMTPGPKPR